MRARLIDALVRLAPRERILLGILCLAILPGALWIAVLEPLAARRAEAAAALSEARALHVWVQARGAEMAALEQADNAGPRAAVGLSGLEQSLISGGLRDAVAGLANAGDGAIELRFEAVDFTALMAWLSAQDPGWGYDITAFRIAQTEAPGRVAAELRLRPQG